MFKAVVFDRDGTLNRNASLNLYYVTRPDELELFSGVKETLTLLRQQNILPFVFTQQNGISKEDWPQMTEEALAAVHARMQEMLGAAAKIEKFYHAPADDHAWAKPGAGMLQAIMDEYGYAPEEMLVVGDSKRDYEAAVAAGCPFVLMQLPGEKEVRLPEGVPVYRSWEDFHKDMLPVSGVDS